MIRSVHSFSFVLKNISKYSEEFLITPPTFLRNDSEKELFYLKEKRKIIVSMDILQNIRCQSESIG
jgi:hypothetical protein